jgi:hypothetical protein
MFWNSVIETDMITLIQVVSSLVWGLIFLKYFLGKVSSLVRVLILLKYLICYHLLSLASAPTFWPWKSGRPSYFQLIVALMTVSNRACRGLKACSNMHLANPDPVSRVPDFYAFTKDTEIFSVFEKKKRATHQAKPNGENNRNIMNY